MNRLVIIGNGFDLAHGLPTGYCDFINDFWKNLKKSYQTEQYTRLLNINSMYYGFLNQGEITCYRDLKESLRSYSKDYGYKYRADLHKCFTSKNENIFEFRNNFFQHICNKYLIQNWVDIENEYYRLLKDCLEDPDNLKVTKLNQEFNVIKNLLEEYLNEKVCTDFNFSKFRDEYKMLDIFNVKYRFLDEANFLEEFPVEDHTNLKEANGILRRSGYDITKTIIENGISFTNLFLSFNYTPTVRSYMRLLTNSDMNYYGDSSSVYIHGVLNDSINKINFGFGDEMDDNYKAIEKKDDNEYLKNIKSFQYLQTSNYKKMLSFLESKKFQVYIMGHSCGLSDRILLNKIFEHHNCRSIKVFYHQFYQPKSDGRTDNYTEIVQNISRHFNKKEMMRERIVNKSLCHPLPQDVRFEVKQNSPQ